MSRDIARSSSAKGGGSSSSGKNASLISELFNSAVFKPNQGRIVRQLTALGVWLVVAFGCWCLYAALRSQLAAGSYLVMAIPGALLATGLWIGYRLVNWPPFADFLIAVEAEMNKVTWPTKEELIRASIVVIFTIFFLAMALFLFDIVWKTIFETIGIGN